MNTLYATINSLDNLTEEERIEIEKSFSIKTFKKGDFFCKENEVCNHLGFIISGYFRIFLSKQEKEPTIHIGQPNNFITSFSSFIDRKPSAEYIQAITTTEVALISFDRLQKLFSMDHKFEKLGRIIVEKHLVDKEKRIISLLTQTAEERYFQLMESDPNIILNVPLQYIASYLGVKPETLSRIRGRRYIPLAS